MISRQPYTLWNRSHFQNKKIQIKIDLHDRDTLIFEKRRYRLEILALVFAVITITLMYHEIHEIKKQNKIEQYAHWWSVIQEYPEITLILSAENIECEIDSGYLKFSEEKRTKDAKFFLQWQIGDTKPLNVELTLDIPLIFELFEPTGSKHKADTLVLKDCKLSLSSLEINEKEITNDINKQITSLRKDYVQKIKDEHSYRISIINSGIRDCTAEFMRKIPINPKTGYTSK